MPPQRANVISVRIEADGSWTATIDRLPQELFRGETKEEAINAAFEASKAHRSAMTRAMDTNRAGDIGDAVVALMDARRKIKPAAQPTSIPSEPGAVSLFRRIVAYRDGLAKGIAQWEELREHQRCGWERHWAPSGDCHERNVPKDRREAAEKNLKTSEEMITKYISGLRSRLNAVDSDIRADSKEDAAAGRGFRLAGLRKLAQQDRELGREHAIAHVELYLKIKNERTGSLDADVDRMKRTVAAVGAGERQRGAHR